MGLKKIGGGGCCTIWELVMNDISKFLVGLDISTAISL